MAINAGSVYSQLILDTGNFEQNLRKAEQQLKSFSNNLTKDGQKLADIGAKMTKMVSVPIAGIGAIATKSAIDFESAFAGVRKTVDASEKDFARLEKGIREMSKEIPASATAIAEVAESAGQLGIETGNILDFTRVMIDLGEATNLTADEASTALARFANITQMSQQDFDRLGSTIVALGNNLATTEAEIVAMSLRLAGAGKQLGLTEAEIMSFAGALSSVGIEAEAGGSSFSKLMVDMQLAVETGGGNLANFAKVAGMTSKEFQRAFKEDATAAIIAFINGLAESEKRGTTAIKVLDDMEIKEVRLRDALLRAAGASEVFNQSITLGNQAWEENTALTAEAEQRYKTTASQIAIAKNYLMDAGITIGEIVVPHLVSLAEKVKNAAEWFNNLSPATQETIVKFAALVAAAGPVLTIGGKISQGIGGIIGLFGKLAPAATTATSAVTTGMGAAGTAVKMSTMLLNPWVLGITAASAGAVALGYHLSKDAIPQVELFGDEVSKSTKQAVSAFLELEDEAMSSLKQLHWGSQVVTADMVSQISGNFGQMRSQVVSELNSQKEEALRELGDLFSNSLSMTAEQKQKLVEMTVKSYDDQIKKTEEGTRRILEILQNASNENRELTQEEYREITAIEEDMRETAIRTLSESEAEQLAIMERLKASSGKLAAQQAADIIQKSYEQKEETIKNAEEEYIERLKWVAQLRTQGTEEANKMADKIAEASERQYEQAKENAEKMHKAVIKEAREQAGEHAHLIDEETGKIKSNWQVVVEFVKKSWEDRKKEYRAFYEALGGDWIDGLIKGIQDRKAKLDKKLDEINADMADKFTEYFGIQSPSRLMAEYGRYISEGLAKGIEDNSNKPKKAMVEMANVISEAYNKAMEITVGNTELIRNKLDLWVLQNQALEDSAEHLTLKLQAQQVELNELTTQIELTEKALNDIVYEYGKGSAEALVYENKLVSLQKEQARLTNTINETKEALETIEVTNLINSFDKAQSYLRNVTSIAEKEYQLWLLATDSVETETEALTMKLSMLEQQQTELNQTINNAQEIYNKMVETYGETSDEALKYKNVLLDLQIQQEKLKDSVEETTKALENQSRYYVDSKGVIRQGINPNVGGTAPQRAAILRGIMDDANALRQAGYSDNVINNWIESQKKARGFNAYASGTIFSKAGLALVGERGPELIELPQGSRVYNNKETKDILAKRGGDIIQNITINSPVPHSPSEEKRAYLQLSRQLAMEWRG